MNDNNPLDLRLFISQHLSSFQVIEEPILTGRLGNHPVERIEAVPPTVPGMSESFYEFWPHGHAFVWVSGFGSTPKAEKWRDVKSQQALLRVGIAASPKDSCRK